MEGKNKRCILYSIIVILIVIVGIIFFYPSSPKDPFNVQEIDSALKEKIDSSFNSPWGMESRTKVYLQNAMAKIEQEEDYGVVFAVRNSRKNISEPQQFNYNVEISSLDDGIEDCKTTSEKATSYIVSGSEGSFNLASGESYYSIIRFDLPESAPLCTIRYLINVTQSGELYAQDFFDVKIIK